MASSPPNSVKILLSAILVRLSSAYTVAYSAYPAPAYLGDDHTCNITTSSEGTIITGTVGAPGCGNIGPTPAFYGNFTLQGYIPANETCALNWFDSANCTGLIGPIPPQPFGTSVGLPLNDTAPTTGCILLSSGHYGLPPIWNFTALSAQVVCGAPAAE